LRRLSFGKRRREEILEPPDTSLLDLLDRLLTKGVMLNGDITMGVAGVDLIYLRLSSIFCAADRLRPRERAPRRRRIIKPTLGQRLR
jgi:hypothetical protein